MSEEQSGFRTGGSCTDNTFILQVIEKHSKCNRETHNDFADFEKDLFDLIGEYCGKYWSKERKLDYWNQSVRTILEVCIME